MAEKIDKKRKTALSTLLVTCTVVADMVSYIQYTVVNIRVFRMQKVRHSLLKLVFTAYCKELKTFCIRTCRHNVETCTCIARNINLAHAYMHKF